MWQAQIGACTRFSLKKKFAPNLDVVISQNVLALTPPPFSSVFLHSSFTLPSLFIGQKWDTSIMA